MNTGPEGGQVEQEYRPTGLTRAYRATTEKLAAKNRSDHGLYGWPFVAHMGHPNFPLKLISKLIICHGYSKKNFHLSRINIAQIDFW